MMTGHIYRTYLVNEKSIRLSKKDKLVYETVTKLKSNLLSLFGIDFQLKGSLERGYINLEDIYYKEGWQQFYFRFCNNDKGIYLKQLKLPDKFQRKRIGTYCINWLKDFCREFGYRYIILGSLEGAVGFWNKMGFQELPLDVLEKDYPWW